MATEEERTGEDPQPPERGPADLVRAGIVAWFFLPIRLGRLVFRYLGPVPLHYAFFFTYAMGPGIAYDLRLFLPPYVAWVGHRLGRSGMVVFAIATLPVGLFEYRFGPWHVGTGLAGYLAAVAVGFLFASPGALNERIATAFGRPVLLWLRRPYWVLLLLGVAVQLEFEGLEIDYSPLGLALLTAFLIGVWVPTQHIPPRVVQARRIVTFFVAAYLIGAFLRGNVPRGIGEVHFSLGIALDGLWPLLSLMTAFLLGRAMARVLTGAGPAPSVEGKVLVSLCVWMLVFFFLRFSAGVASPGFTFNISAFTASLLLYGICLVAGARYGLAGVINVIGLSLVLFVATKVALLLMNAGLPFGDEALTGYRRGFAFTEMWLDNGMRVRAEAWTYRLSVLNGVLAPIVYALLGWRVATRFRATDGPGSPGEGTPKTA